MARKHQTGILFNTKIFNYKNSVNKYTNNKSFAILFLKVRKKSNINYLASSIEKLWDMYENLKKGIVKDLPHQRVPHGFLSIILGYGQNVFQLKNIVKEIPRDFKNSQFLSPKKDGGGYIL